MGKQKGPDIDRRREPSGEYITELVEQAKQRHGITSQREVARRLGLSITALKDFKAGKNVPNYRDQYALEAMAGHF